jgi:hypothetical protein
MAPKPIGSDDKIPVSDTSVNPRACFEQRANIARLSNLMLITYSVQLQNTW